jgi:hypothetical protein
MGHKKRPSLISSNQNSITMMMQHRSPEKKYTTRLQAMKEWNSMNGDARKRFTDFHYPGRKFNSLTGREIHTAMLKTKQP